MRSSPARSPGLALSSWADALLSRETASVLLYLTLLGGEAQVSFTNVQSGPGRARIATQVRCACLHVCHVFIWKPAVGFSHELSSKC